MVTATNLLQSFYYFFTTGIENLGIPKNHISQLMGHEDDNMALDLYSGGLAIEPLRKSIDKSSYGENIQKLLLSYDEREQIY